MNKILLVLAGAALVALLAVPAAAADIATTSDLGTVTTLTSDQIDALGIPWEASLEDWSTALDPPTYQCVGVLPPGTYGDVTVPPGATCTMDRFDIIEHDLTVLQGARLIDFGASIGHDIRATKPSAMQITGDGVGFPGIVGHDIHIEGTSSGLPLTFEGTTFPGGPFNFICNQQVGHDAVVQKSLSTASPWEIGDPADPGPTGGFFVGCGNAFAHDLVVKDNANTIDISANDGVNQGAPFGIGHDLKIANNSGGTTVNANTAGHDCTQSNNSPYLGTGNAAVNNNCNAAY
jgi:hypothetical protein